jgi:hypothetical protein
MNNYTHFRAQLSKYLSEQNILVLQLKGKLKNTHYIRLTIPEILTVFGYPN